MVNPNSGQRNLDWVLGAERGLMVRIGVFKKFQENERLIERGVLVLDSGNKSLGIDR